MAVSVGILLDGAEIMPGHVWVGGPGELKAAVRVESTSAWASIQGSLGELERLAATIGDVVRNARADESRLRAEHAREVPA